ncbi:MAG: ClpXP protease specificity-enhancing factor [Gammaproteobacteria bacterium]|nr:ClpXP protease specificity-enhancing factor [Gammaproteobacteria bacterium]
MISTKPYLIRAIRDWARDNNLTPQILVDASADGVRVPQSYVADGQIVLNIADQAVEMMEMGNDFLSFAARFNGSPHEIDVPIESVLAIFARENGQGIFFKDPDGSPDPGGNEDKADKEQDKPAKPNLKLVK